MTAIISTSLQMPIHVRACEVPREHQQRNLLHRQTDTQHIAETSDEHKAIDISIKFVLFLVLISRDVSTCSFERSMSLRGVPCALEATAGKDDLSRSTRRGLLALDVICCIATLPYTPCHIPLRGKLVPRVVSVIGTLALHKSSLLRVRIGDCSIVTHETHIRINNRQSGHTIVDYNL
jgi:hypothetical protein